MFAIPDLSALDFIVGVVTGWISTYTFERNKRINTEKSKYSFCTVKFKDNIFHSYLLNDNFNSTVELSNQSDFHWRDIEVNVFTSYFLNTIPNIFGNDNSTSVIPKLTKRFDLLKSGDSVIVESHFISLFNNENVSDDADVLKILLDPFVSVKERAASIEVENPENDSESYSLLKMAILESCNGINPIEILLSKLAASESGIFGGFIDFVLVRGRSIIRGSKEVEFLKLFPIINFWSANGDVRHHHDVKHLNGLFDVKEEFKVRRNNQNISLESTFSQYVAVHGEPEIDSIRGRMLGHKIGYQHLLVDAIMNFSGNEVVFRSNLVLLIAEDGKEYKGIPTVKPNETINTFAHVFPINRNV